MVGIAQGLERQVVALEAEGSIPSIHPIFHIPSRGAEGGDKREGEAIRRKGEGSIMAPLNARQE